MLTLLRVHLNLGLVLLIFLFSLVATPSKAKPAAKEYANLGHTDLTQELIRLRTEGMAYFESGIAQKKALAIFQRAITLPGSGAVDQFNLAVIYRKLNKIEESIRHLKKSIKLDPKLAHPHYLLGLIHVGADKAKEAFSEFTQAVKLQPNEASVHYQLSRIHRENGDKQKALQSIVETLRLDPYHTGAMYQFYLHHQQGGDKEKAKQIFKEFSRLKKALGRTRKEINPDESALARPLNYEFSELKTPFSAIISDPVFSLQPLADVGRVSGYSVADVNNDKIQDMVIATANGDISVWLNDPDNGFSLHTKGAGVSGADCVQLVKFKRGEPYFVLLSSDNGLNLLPLKDAEPKPKDPKAKHHNAKNKQPPVIKLVVGAAESLSDKASCLVSLVDVDHDGDIDIIMDGFKQVWINRGNAKFDMRTDYLPDHDIKHLETLQYPMLGGDFRNQIAVDLIAVSKNSKRWILRDDMGGKYKLFDDRLPEYKNIYWYGRADMDNDGQIDIVNLTDKGLSIDYNLGNLRFKSRHINKPLAEISEALIVDFNNDGYKDVIYSLKQGGIQVWINAGAKEYKQSKILVSNSQLHQLKVIDSNSDGRLDIVAINNADELVLLVNQTDTSGAKWIALTLDGIRSASDGRYTQVEVRYGGFYTKYEAQGDLVHVPLGQATHAELLRITWPNGFVENKFNVQPEVTWYFAESERISGSCPSVYAWNGERYVYITDSFISGPMGVPVAPGKYFPVGDDEYVKIPGEHMSIDEDGNYRISIVEELKEVTYLDEVRLYAVDYPDTYYMFPNEYLMPPELPEFKLHLSATAKPPRLATDHLGNDVTDLIREVDYRYPHEFSRLDYTGFSENHGIELGLSSQDLQSKDLRLFLTGWFYYFDSSSLIAVSQQPEVQLLWPQVQVFRQGKWSFLKKIGIPSGKEKTVVVELGGEVPADAEKIRIWTNVELYWDRVLIDTSPAPEPSIYTMNQLDTVDSRLRLHGFSALIRPEGEFPMPDRFDYHKTSFRSLWNPLDGRYTRYGEVNELINKIDGKFTVFGSGDELALTFRADQLPTVKPGFKRDFLIYLNGFVKDGDKYTAHAGSVDPMPYVGLRAYPYSEQEREAAGFDSESYQKYLQEYQYREPLRFTGLDALID